MSKGGETKKKPHHWPAREKQFPYPPGLSRDAPAPPACMNLGKFPSASRIDVGRRSPLRASWPDLVRTARFNGRR